MIMIPIRYNVRSLLVRRSTTLATAFGIALVVFVLASSLMLSAGIERMMGRSGSPANAVVLRNGSSTELSSGIESRFVNLVLAAPGVKKDATGAPLGAGEVLLVIALEKVGGAAELSNVQLRGVTDRVFDVRPEAHVIDGRAPRPGTDEVMIGKLLRGRFKGMDLGSSFELKKNRSVQVVGVFEAGGSAYESEVWADVGSVRSAFGRDGLVSSVTLQLESPRQFEAFAAHIESDKQLGLSAMRQSTYFERASERTATLVAALGICVTAFFSLGAIIGAIITMHAAVAQRQREIGTLRALGFSRTNILCSFVAETVLLTTAGGVLGALAALAMTFVKFSLVNVATWSEMVISFEPTAGIVGNALALGGVMGIVGGLLPALRAARTSPIEAMRA